MLVKPGQILLGKYRFERVIGRGGIGLVAKAHHLHLDESVAIKFLLPQAAKDKEVVKRFIREGQAAVKLKSEHVCRVLDVGMMDNGSPYMVMEYMAGIDLRRLLKKHTKIHPNAAVDFLLQACAALGEAHSLGVIHRDIKPANLFITTRTDGSDILKVLDFGISKVQDTAQEDITHAHTLLGTPAYMSPEQMRTPKDVDGRTDIWALGIVLYELLSGTRPFRGDAFSELCLQVVSDPVPPMEGVELPPGLADVVMHCLQKPLEDRFQNVAALSSALAPYAADPDQAISLVQRTSRSLQVPILPPDLLTGSHISRNAVLTDSQNSRLSRSHISQHSHISQLSSNALITHDSQISVQPGQNSAFGTGSGSTLGQGLGQVVTPVKPKRRRVWWLAALLLLFMAGVGFVVISGSPKTGAAEKSASPVKPAIDDPTRRDTPPGDPGDKIPDDGTDSTENGIADGSSATGGDAGVAEGDSDGGLGETEVTVTVTTPDNPPGDSAGKVDKVTKKNKNKKKKRRKKNETDDGDDDDDFLDSRN